MEPAASFVTPSMLISLGVFMIGFATLSLTLFQFVTRSSAVVRDKLEVQISTVETKLDTKLDTMEKAANIQSSALRTEFDLKIERVGQVESKARHDQNNNLTVQFAKLEQTVARLDDRAVRKEDLSRVEQAVRDLGAKISHQDVLAAEMQGTNKRMERMEGLMTQLLARGTPPSNALQPV